MFRRMIANAVLVGSAAFAVGYGVGWAQEDTIAVPIPAPAVVNVAPLVGDDNGDGVIDEDESGWDCRTMGNRVCGR